jgi:DNA-binding response OmpR family regulator
MQTAIGKNTGTITQQGNGPTTESFNTQVQGLKRALTAATVLVETLLRQDTALGPPMQRELLECLNDTHGQCHRWVEGIEAIAVPPPAGTVGEIAPGTDASAPISVGDVVIKPGDRVVTAGNKRISLTRTEHKLLLCMARNAGQFLPLQTILSEVWGNEYPGGACSVRAYIKRLRRKLEDNTGGSGYIINKYRAGYKFVPSNGHQDRQEP